MVLRVFIVFFLGIILQLINIKANNIPVFEYDALEDFYTSTEGNEWSWRSLSVGEIWNFSMGASETFPCINRWQGLSCSSACFDGSGFCHIVGINLTDYNLNGPIPATFGNLSNLDNIILNNNFLSGSLLPSFFNFHNATLINLANNSLSGSIASRDLVKFNSLQSLDLSSNEFSGPLPLGENSVRVRAMPQLINIALGMNQFSGPIPSSVGNFTSLRVLALEDNRLTGFIPASIGLLTNLKELDLDSNMLTGSLPSSMTSMTSLEILFLQQNSLGPDFGSAIAGMTSLTTLNMADNNFQGSIPSQLFNLPHIETVILTQNCFSGSIPDSVCNAVELVNLDLDGLTSGSGCLKRVARAYISHYMTGSIPSCVYTLPLIQLLHAAGNGFHATLPDNINLSPSLKDVVMSYNRIGGSIPKNFQHFPFNSFDLSYNKLSGTCQDMSMNLLGENGTGGSSATHLSLSVNRLSGLLASDFLNAPYVDVLAGNLFSCNQQSELPANDPGSSTAVCGTQVTNLSFYGVTIAFGVALCWFLWYTFKGFNPKSYEPQNNDLRAAALSTALRRSVTASRASEATDFHLQSPEEDDWKGQKNRSTTAQSVEPLRVVSSVELGSRGRSVSSEHADLLSIPFIQRSQEQHSQLLQGKLQKLLGAQTASRATRHSRVDIFETSDLYTTKPFRGENAKNQNIGQYVWHTYISKPENQSSHFFGAIQAHLLTKSLFQWVKITNFVMHLKPEELIETTRFLKLLVEIRNTFWVITFFICFITLPVFLGFREPNFVTHTYQYAYIPSIAYFAGIAPALAFLLLIVSCAILILYAMTKIQSFDTSTTASRKAEKDALKFTRSTLHNCPSLMQNLIGESSSTFNSPPSDPSTPMAEGRDPSIRHVNSVDSVDNAFDTHKEIDSHLPYSPSTDVETDTGCKYLQGKFKLYVTIPVINFVVILLVNILYLYIIFTQGRNLKLFTTTCISLFKMIWNMLVLPGLFQSVKGNGPMFIRKLVVQMCLMIFNMVLLPCLVNAIVSPDCLLRLFFPPATLVASAPISICVEYNSAGVCVARADDTISTSFEPPFIYSYQCASSTLVDYSPAFIQMYGMIACIMPTVAVIMFVLMEMNTDTPKASHDLWGRFVQWLSIFLKNLKPIPPIYRMCRLLGTYATVDMVDQSKERDSHAIKNPLHKSDSDSKMEFPDSNEINSKKSLDANTEEEFVPFTKQQRRAILLEYHNSNTRKEIPDAPTQTILNPDTIFSHLMGHIMVLITFGFAYPPLAVLITITVSVVTFQWQVRNFITFSSHLTYFYTSICFHVFILIFI